MEVISRKANMIYKNTDDIRSDFNATLDRIKENHGIDIRNFWLLDIGPELNAAMLVQFFAFYQRGYDQARLDLAN